MNKIITNEKGNLTVEVNETAMEAYLTIKLTDEVIDEQEIEELVLKAGLKYGFDTAVEYNQEHEIEKEFDEPFLIAKGGLDPFKSELICKFEAETCYAPGKDPSRVSLTGWCYVDKGTKLAEIKVDETSNAIKNVYGDTVEQHDLHTLYSGQYIGSNVTFNEKDRAVYSTIDGYPYLDNNGKIGVIDTLEIDGALLTDVDYLHFRSSVIINGNIKGCKLVLIDGDLTIKGDIEKSSVYCIGDVKVEGLVGGCKPIGIVSEGSIEFGSGRVSFLFARGNITPERQVIDSRMVAGNAIKGSIKTSGLTGGSIFAGNLIAGGYAGDRFNSATRIEIKPACWETMIIELFKKIVENKVFPEAVIIDELKTLSSKIKSLPELRIAQEEVKGISFNGKVFPGVEMVVNNEIKRFEKVQNNV
ncbi:MAG: FapA family protein, partial [Candidatus Zophobacter franzmannii]|nr:FapA family protein [Candidatus Zophobacter franzmannii]